MRDYKQLFQEQSTSWILAANNYKALSSVLFKDFLIDGFRIRLQFNAGRIISSSANVSKDVIQARPCFLCAKNRPAEQDYLIFKDEQNKPLNTELQILVNPFPVFPQHFTIAATNHQIQAISGHFETMLRLAKSMDDSVVFYNGPRCGASAPDHLHFQAGSKGLMPVESDYDIWKQTNRSSLCNGKDIQIYKLDGLLRNGWLLEGNNQSELVKALELLLKSMETIHPSVKEEPMLNLLCWYRNENWMCALFPRKAHRPKCYFREDESRLLISPASVEMGGLIVAARQDDFERITSEDIRDIFKDVSISESDIDLISDRFTDEFKKNI